ncbi:carbohydrate-binding wsc [Diplodia corticola]|uniref:Carbohydrate-binding wsc n=1 Tax=Diplodia corticola TaxID=236234 RepID=A0A1J9RSV2_9PEZI|nr:carbohydrate-binding wsc [Diplodia corticola]OJD35635.1 carbohydrate-binding wsc [Diplodia corticola]
MLTTSASTLELCIDACDSNSGCVDVAWVYGSCYLKSSVGTAISNNAVLGAKLITSSPSSSTSASSSGTSSTVGVSSSASSSSASSSSTSSSFTSSSSTVSSSTVSSSTASSSTASSSTVSSSTASSSTSTASSSTSTASSSTSTASSSTSTASSSTTSSSATPSSSTISCPTSDGKTISGPRGQKFLIECGTDHQGGDMGAPTYPGSFAACVAQCDATDGCVDVSYVSNGPCYLKGTLGGSLANAGIWGAKLTASLPSGIAARGCHADSAAARTFPTQAYANSSNTPGLCASACREKGYKYAGTQYGTECWCGPSLPSTAAAAADCSSACAGDAGQACGGSFRLSVTEDTAWTQKFFARQSYGTWSLASCYRDNVDGKRTLGTSVSIDAGSATVAKCLDACAAKGFAYCGAEYYYECYGGAAKPADALVVPDVADPLLAGCDYACSGNSTEACGGADRLLVYVNNGTRV